MDTAKNKFNLTSITWPLFVQSFLGLLMGNINVFMLGHFSDKAVGAVGVTNQIIGMLSIIYGVISMGTAILITQNLGAKNLKLAKAIAQMSIFLNTFFGFIFSLILIIFGKTLLKIMNLPEEMLPYGSVYIIIVGGSSFLSSAIAIFSSILRSYGHAKLPMKIAVLINLLNITGNYISLFRPFGLPALGVEGVAISVVLSNTIGLAIIGFITTKNLNLKLFTKDFFSMDLNIIKLIMKIGGPAAGEYISYSLSQIVVTYIITSLGTEAINTRIYLQNITSFVSMLSLSIGQGSQILVGYMMGGGKLNKMHNICIKSLKIAVFSNFALALILYIFSPKLLGLFTSNPSIIHIGKTILLIDIFLEVGRAFNHVVGNSLRGIGDVRYPVIVSVSSMWLICVLLSLVFGINLKFGLVGMWIASGLDEWFRGVVLLKRWYSKPYMRIKLVSE